jgi:hypothetical protein
MEWILIGIVAGSIVTSGHPTKEACLGRVGVLKEQKIVSACYPSPGNGTIGFGTMTSPVCCSITTCGAGLCTQ